MSKGKPLTDISPQRFENSSKLVEISPSKLLPGKRPIVGITYLEVLSGDYSLKRFAKTESKSCGTRQLYNELEEFLIKARSYSAIEELISAHAPKKRIKNSDEKSISKMKEIQRKYNVETSEMVHLHCKRCGSGAFVLHGFVVNNCFEVVWLDPNHALHKD